MAEPPFPIAICGIDEIAGHCALGATHVLSILDPDRAVPEGFGAWGEHERLELRFHDIVDPEPGLVVPAPAHVEAVLRLGRDILAEAASRPNLLVHCHAGISRSTASMALILAQAMPDVAAGEILSLVHRIRGKAWPNLLIMEIGDALLGRGGSLVRATSALHRAQIDQRPDLAAMQQDASRGREVAAAMRLAG